MKFSELVEHIKEYESDTFSASCSNLTDEEAIKLAERCIDFFINHDLDGIKLDNWLYHIRPEEN